MPVLLWQAWRFVTPGLHRHEKRWTRPFVFSALVLFVLGAGLAFYSLTPALEFPIVPMYLFYEATIVIGLLLTRGRRRAETVPTA